ncbi:MAG: hypothetical protein AAGG68_28390 [Bacteroidota bacterium]
MKYYFSTNPLGCSPFLEISTIAVPPEYKNEQENVPPFKAHVGWDALPDSLLKQVYKT